MSRFWQHYCSETRYINYTLEGEACSRCGEKDWNITDKLYLCIQKDGVEREYMLKDGNSNNIPIDTRITDDSPT